MGGISGWEGVILLLVVLLVIGPDKLPEVASQLARGTRVVRDIIRRAKVSLQEELGDEFELTSLDPRQYDPRRIVREALLDDSPSPPRPADDDAT